MSIKLNAEIRKVAGKGAARAVRNNKKVPAVIYGDKKEPVAIELDAHEFSLLIRQPGLRTKLFEITTSAGKENAMLMEIQYHPVTDLPMHTDFKRIDVLKPVSVIVPLEIVNAEISKGLKMGGVLNFVVRKVEVVAPINLIPSTIEIDLTNLNIGETVHGSDLKLPNGVTLGLHQEDLAFAIIGGKMAEEEDKPAVAKAAEAAPAAKAAAKPAADKK